MAVRASSAAALILATAARPSVSTTCRALTASASYWATAEFARVSACSSCCSMPFRASSSVLSDSMFFRLVEKDRTLSS